MGLKVEIGRAMEDVPRLDRALAGFLEEREIVGRPAYVAKLVLEEITRNLISHAKGVEGERIRVDLDVVGDHLLLGIEDESAPFDPREAPTPDLEIPLDERTPGGVGLHLVRTLVDELRYERVGDRNRLEVEITLAAKG